MVVEIGEARGIEARIVGEGGEAVYLHSPGVHESPADEHFLSATGGFICQSEDRKRMDARFCRQRGGECAEQQIGVLALLVDDRNLALNAAGVLFSILAEECDPPIRAEPIVRGIDKVDRRDERHLTRPVGGMGGPADAEKQIRRWRESRIGPRGLVIDRSAREIDQARGGVA